MRGQLQRSAAQLRGMAGGSSAVLHASRPTCGNQREAYLGWGKNEKTWMVHMSYGSFVQFLGP